MKVAVRRLRRCRTVIAALFAAAGLIMGLEAMPAFAAGPTVAQFCQTSSGNYCLNDWNGANAAVQMYGGGTGNEEFVAERVTGRCNDGLVDSSCPFNSSTFNSRYSGFPIVQLWYQPSGTSKPLCVGTDINDPSAPSLAYLSGCNTSAQGTGGGTGTIFIDHDGYLINLYWSNGSSDGNAACMSGTASNGGNVVLDYDTADGCPSWNNDLYESTNYDWASWVLHDGGWPQSANNLKVLTEWMVSEEPVDDWYHNADPLNVIACSSTSDTCPNLFDAAQEVVNYLGGSSYSAIASDLASSASPSTTASAICASPWDTGHYDNCADFYTGTAATDIGSPSAW